MVKLVILDRDGVINRDLGDYVKTACDWHAIEGSLPAIAKLNQRNIKVAIASNQAGIARGLFTHDDLAAINDNMCEQIAGAGGHLDFINYCADARDSGSWRRKPAGGMLIECSEQLNVALTDTVFIGDKYSDYQAAVHAGCDFILVLTGYGHTTISDHPELYDLVPVHANLATAVSMIIKETT